MEPSKVKVSVVVHADTAEPSMVVQKTLEGEVVLNDGLEDEMVTTKPVELVEVLNDSDQV